MLSKVKNALLFEGEGQIVKLSPYGKNAIRVRARVCGEFGERYYALLPNEEIDGEIEINEEFATIKNGNAFVRIDKNGRIYLYNQNNELLLREVVSGHPLKIKAREFNKINEEKYQISVRFDSSPCEKIFGMGQYQQPYLNIKGCTLELAHRNSQASVPFYLSSLGYGFLWNMPSIGECTFGKNVTKWTALMGEEIDYVVFVGNSPAEIIESYADATGKPPMMPEYAMGLWQSKLRYRDENELLEVAREYKRRGVPLSVIVCDFFHWPHQGDFKFDRHYFPNAEKMVKELNEMGTELMVSVWPTIEFGSESFEEMEKKGYLIKNHRGRRNHTEFIAPTVFYDTTNDEAGKFVWSKIKSNYYDMGIKIFWLDEAEPEYDFYDFDNHIYHMGDCLEVGNIYPLKYAQNFYDGMSGEGQENVLNLIRCAWAGSQRYGALVWSGDIKPTYDAFKCQVRAGLNMAMSGIPWWTTDIGGFDGGCPDDEDYRQLILRWFEYATFCPVLRMHGNRIPRIKDTLDCPHGGGKCGSGAPNEIWSYGTEAYEIFKKYVTIRENLKPYIKELMSEAHNVGTPPMRPLFYDFPSDKDCWDIDDELMFGSDLLVCPVINENEYKRCAYLPACDEKWVDVWTGDIYDGGITVECDCPLDKIPLFIKENGRLNRNIFIGD